MLLVSYQEFVLLNRNGNKLGQYSAGFTFTLLKTHKPKIETKVRLVCKHLGCVFIWEVLCQVWLWHTGIFNDIKNYIICFLQATWFDAQWELTDRPAGDICLPKLWFAARYLHHVDNSLVWRGFDGYYLLSTRKRINLSNRNRPVYVFFKPEHNLTLSIWAVVHFRVLFL